MQNFNSCLENFLCTLAHDYENIQHSLHLQMSHNRHRLTQHSLLWLMINDQNIYIVMSIWKDCCEGLRIIFITSKWLNNFKNCFGLQMKSEWCLQISINYFFNIFSDMDSDVARQDEVCHQLLHCQPQHRGHHERHPQRHPQLHLHAHRKLAFWYDLIISEKLFFITTYSLLPLLYPVKTTGRRECQLPP